MSRTARIDIPNLQQHVIVRGIERRDIFADDDDRRLFVKRFSDLLVSSGTDCLAWSQLDNHAISSFARVKLPWQNSCGGC
jgi:REP element-mobilizing transposase RayT